MKALSVFSGGLDSILSAEVIRAQGIQVQAVFFETPFFPSNIAQKSAESIKIPLNIIDITERHLKIVKHPMHGYGENMNPCIDCHILMFRIAGELLEQEDARFIITGEVLGQRPMSQNRKSLDLIDAQSGYKGLILRPLSAKHLPPSIPEEKGWIDRERLYAISGRTRKPQMELAERLNITGYPSPAGGCLLTDKRFSQRLQDLFSARIDPDRREIDLLRVGRHFRIGPNTKIIIGRNRAENYALKSMSREEDIVLSTLTVPGPASLLVGDIIPGAIELAASMTVSYSDADDNVLTELVASSKNGDKMLKFKGISKNDLKRYMI